MNLFRQDPGWQKFSASLRDGKVYVKMPLSKARMLSLAWMVLQQAREGSDFLTLPAHFVVLAEDLKAAEEHQLKSVFMRLTEKQCQEDVYSLRWWEGTDGTGLFALYRECLELALKGDPSVDWVARIGGPPSRKQPTRGNKS